MQITSLFTQLYHRMALNNIERKMYVSARKMDNIEFQKLNMQRLTLKSIVEYFKRMMKGLN